jgi:hypothetical protein
MTTIQHEITPGLFIKIDADDLWLVQQHQWNTKKYTRPSGEHYQIVQRGMRGLSLMHYIVGCHRSQRVHRRNGDTTDFTRLNLVPSKIRRGSGSAPPERAPEAVLPPRGPEHKTHAMNMAMRMGKPTRCHEEAMDWINGHSDLRWMTMLRMAYGATE